MRNLHREAAIWNLFTSPAFFEAAAQECDNTMAWFGTLAVARDVADFGRNNQIFDTFKTLARDFRRTADMAKLGDYRPIWRQAGSVRGDVRGMMDQPLHGWMTKAEYEEFGNVRISILLTYARIIDRSLHNAMVGADSFLSPNPDCPERSDEDDAFPGVSIIQSYQSYIDQFDSPTFPDIPHPLPEYVVDRSIACRTGDEVPWTGVWIPSTGTDRTSLTFAAKGARMQPVYKILKTREELKQESEDPEMIFYSPQTVAVAATWHPFVLSGRLAEQEEELRAKAGEPCPKAGIWQPMESGAAQRRYEAGQPMGNLGSAYGITVWRWMADR